MKVLLLTDIHGNTENLSDIIEKEDFDSVLCAGDLGDAREYDDYTSNLYDVLDIMESGSGLVKAVPGNMDPEEDSVRALIDRKMNIHKKIASFEEFEVVGFGGGITPFGTPFEPSGQEINDSIEILYQRMSSSHRFAVIHQPPKDTDLDVAQGNHVGSSEVKKLIEEENFDFLLTGHIHESRGQDELAGTLMANPGPVNQGYYATLNVEDDLELNMKQL